MPCEASVSLSTSEIRKHVAGALARYWSGAEDLVGEVPVTELPLSLEEPVLRLVEVRLPEWGAHAGVESVILVPREACGCSERPLWDEVDWWLAAFLLLECWHERAWEQRHGPIHSYAFRLKLWDMRAWERAWVNRIALFLRAWRAQIAGVNEETLFGPKPVAEIVLTHDVDALKKTWAIRLKQGAFGGVNALRLLARGRVGAALGSLGTMGRFLFFGGDWWTVSEIRNMERAAGLRGHFNFYADDRPKNAKRWLFDPGYNVREPRIGRLLRELVSDGWGVGLHQSYDAWECADAMRLQKEKLQSQVGVPVTSCRQHWLRFSWQDTWAAQSMAGLGLDTTLMFNDRPGFRAAAALEWSPWNQLHGREHCMRVLPSLFMDSHFFDYMPMNGAERRAAMRQWLGEVRAVGGRVAVLWHPHTITADYGWKDGFVELLESVKGVGTC